VSAQFNAVRGRGSLTARLGGHSPSSKFVLVRVRVPYHKLLPAPGKTPTRTARFRGATQNLRGGAPHTESQPTSEITPFHTSAFQSAALTHAPFSHQAHRGPTHTSGHFTFLFARSARAYTPYRRIGFCAIWVCTSSSSSSLEARTR
jgi:hypothetical protein